MHLVKLSDELQKTAVLHCSLNGWNVEDMIGRMLLRDPENEHGAVTYIPLPVTWSTVTRLVKLK